MKNYVPMFHFFSPVAQLVASPIADPGLILSLVMKYFLRSSSSFCWFKKGWCQLQAKVCAQSTVKPQLFEVPGTVEILSNNR